MCEICHPEGRKDKEGEDMIKSGRGCYTGETSRSLLERIVEHAADARKMERDSHQVKHWFLDHQEVADPPRFRYMIVGSYKDAMSRQVKEAIRIQNRPGSLNSKGEFGGGGITRLVVEKSVVDRRKEEVLTRRKQAEEDVLRETFLIRKQEQEGKRRKAAEEVLAPAAKKARLFETDLPEAERQGKDGEDDDILVGTPVSVLPQPGQWSWM